MKPVVETPEQKLQSKLTRYKNDYNVNVKNAKERYKYDTSDVKGKAKIIDTLLKSPDKGLKKRGEDYFHSERHDDRKIIAREMLGNAPCVKAHVYESSYLNMANLKLSKCHWNVEFHVRTGLKLHHPMDYVEKPSDERVLEIAKVYFPKVKMIQ